MLKPGQHVDELKLCSGCSLLKYDFALIQSGISPKAAGNRCIVLLDTVAHRRDVHLVYNKGDMPKNASETRFIYQLI